MISSDRLLQATHICDQILAKIGAISLNGHTCRLPAGTYPARREVDASQEPINVDQSAVKS